ncbi:FecR domain-containing protein [Altererythrobacter sp. CC-YST694]|nr:FecR domain-containing protein [Altererythrobacter sp. CC-YST694]
MEYGEMTAEDHAELNTWLAADGRHRGAFLRSRAGLYMAEDAVASARAMSAAPEVSRAVSANCAGEHNRKFMPRLSRRIFLPGYVKSIAGGTALAASVAALVAIGLPVLFHFRPTEPVVAEQIVKLKDGSIATLGQGAQIKVVFSPDYRRITLVDGAATFKVAHDKGRPFIVQSGDIYAQATGTIYSVSRFGKTGGTVKVSEGSVLVWQHDDRDQGIMLHAGEELMLTAEPRLTEPKVAASVTSPAQPPKAPQIAFDREPLRSAVARFNRINKTKIVIADPEIGDTEIIGLFRTDDPEQFAEAAAALAGGTVERRGNEIVIKMQ